MPILDITANLFEFINGDQNRGGIKPLERYSSFDYCYNHFQVFKEKNEVEALSRPEYLQLSCLHLGFYLASWGMLRGSTFLLQKSVKALVPVIEAIARADKQLWEIDANSYSKQNISLLLEFKNELSLVLSPYGLASDILTSKIMLGVFGNVPAFDTQFKAGFRVSGFRKSALVEISKFYETNHLIIENNRIFTIDFISGEPTNRQYSRAKVIDMIFFIQGRK